VVSSPPATEETGATGRDIESRQGIGWEVFKYLKTWKKCGAAIIAQQKNIQKIIENQRITARKTV
jgi:hypothetical protein